MNHHVAHRRMTFSLFADKGFEIVPVLERCRCRCRVQTKAEFGLELPVLPGRTGVSNDTINDEWWMLKDVTEIPYNNLIYIVLLIKIPSPAVSCFHRCTSLTFRRETIKFSWVYQSTSQPARPFERKNSKQSIARMIKIWWTWPKCNFVYICELNGLITLYFQWCMGLVTCIVMPC